MSVFSVLSSTSNADVIDVYLQGGQSNTDGRASSSGLPTSPVNFQQPQADVAFFFHTQGSGRALDKTLTTLRPGMSETSQFGPEITFGRDMADDSSSNPNSSIAIIKYGNGGTNLHTQWKAGGDGTTTNDGGEYITFQNTVNDGLAAITAANPDDTIIIRGMIWMQGESDNASSASASAYQTNLTNFIADVRATYGANLPFVIGEIAENNGNVNTATIRAAQAAVAAADSSVGFVDVDSFAMRDHLHFNAAGQMDLGSGFATQMQALLVPDTTVPTPNPMTFATLPFALNSSSISMTATTATDTTGVKYFFESTAGGGNDSGWQDSPTYVDTGLNADTEYSYRVKVRDNSNAQNETGYSAVASATTYASGVDPIPPSPDPMTFSVSPIGVSASSITMTAVTATDASGVEYYFENIAGSGNGGDDSGWQDSPVYVDTGLLEGMEYSYRVKARDKSASQNETAYSATISAETLPLGGINTIISNRDTYINNASQNSNFGSGGNMIANDNGSSVRMVVFSFDISSVPAGTIGSAQLQLEHVIGGDAHTYAVYGLLDAYETFDEATLTWNTAGFTSGRTIDLTKAYGSAMLGSFANVTGEINTIFDVTSGNFIDFLNASSDNEVTFVIVDTNASHTGNGWATKEHANALKPTLILEAANTGYLSWASNYSDLNLTNSSEDNDSDGLANIMESFLGTNPGEWNSGLSAVSSGAIITEFTHPQSASPPNDVLGYYQWSPNLKDWYGDGEGPIDGPTATITSLTEEGVTTATLTLSEEIPQSFLRIKAEPMP